MSVSYDKLFKLLIDKQMRKGELCKAAGISGGVLLKFSNKMGLSSTEEYDLGFLFLVSATGMFTSLDAFIESVYQFADEVSSSMQCQTLIKFIFQGNERVKN